LIDNDDVDFQGQSESISLKAFEIEAGQSDEFSNNIDSLEMFASETKNSTLN
jgi:hypothetical protein